MPRILKFIGPLSLAAAAGLVMAEPARAQDPAPTYQKVALSGTDPAPGTVGLFYRGFERPTINSSGQVAFYGLYGPATGDPLGIGIWTGLPEDIHLVASEGGVAPDTDGLTFSGFGGARVGLSDTGAVIFLGTLSGAASTANNGVWIGTWDDLHLLAREDEDAPTGGYDIDEAPFSGVQPKFNNNLGQAVIGRGGIGGFSSAISGDETHNGLHEHSLFGGNLGTNPLAPLALAGTQVFGESEGVLYANLQTTPRLNTSGQSAFAASLKGDETGTAIFVGAPGDAAVVAAQGRAAPGMTTGITFEAIQFPDLNDSGEVAFVASLAGLGSDGNPFLGEAIYFGSVGAITPIAVIDQPAAGTPLVYDEFLSTFGPMINDAGQIAFAALVSGTGTTSSNDLVIVAGTAADDTTFVFAAREGTGLPQDITLQDSPLINNNGDIAFYLSDGEGETSLWMTNLSGDLVRIVGSGDDFLIDAGNPEDPFDDDVREVLALKMGTNTDGYQYLSDNGTVVFGLAFTDGTEGIFTSNIVVPEPTGCALLLGAAGLFLRRRR